MKLMPVEFIVVKGGFLYSQFNNSFVLSNNFFIEMRFELNPDFIAVEFFENMKKLKFEFVTRRMNIRRLL